MPHHKNTDDIPSEDWFLDFSHKHVAKILSDLAWYGDIQSKTILYRDENRTPKIVYWKGSNYDWGSDL